MLTLLPSGGTKQRAALRNEHGLWRQRASGEAEEIRIYSHSLPSVVNTGGAETDEQQNGRRGMKKLTRLAASPVSVSVS